MTRRALIVVSCVCGGTLPCVAADSPPTGNSVIRGKAGGSEIVLRTTERLAGAIHSLTWNGKEFIDSHDHGRQLQSACSFDGGRPGEFWAECFNPTEAGSRLDGAGPNSTSRLLTLRAEKNELETLSQMAFWLAPGEKSEGRPGFNTTKLSNHKLAKRVRIGFGDHDNVLDYEVVFTVPEGEGHRYAQFEALTGYMPAEFERFETFDPATGELKPVDDGPGEQRLPVVFSTKSGRHAMGVISPDQPSKGFENAGYGRFRFKAEKVVKWNCVFRVRSDKGIEPGEYRYRQYVPVGTREDVRRTLAALAK